MQRVLAIVLVLIGVVGLALGRLGETTWAPETETTATVDLADPGSAVIIDPGVLYVGGSEGQVVIEGASDVSVITAAGGDIEAYLEDVRYTRITGASDWTTLTTQEVNADGAEEISSPTTSDLWRSVETQPSPYTFEVSDFRAGEHGENEQAYRAILLVTDGTAPGADSVSITWPVDAENEWVPFAYAGGAAIAVIGLVLLVVSIGGSRRRTEDEELLEQDEAEELAPQPADAGAHAAAPGVLAAEAEDEEGTGSRPAAESPGEPTGDGLDDLLGAPAQPGREENIWSLGEPTAPEAGPEAEPAADAEAEPAADEPAPEDDTAARASSLEDGPEEDTGSPVRLEDDEERR